MPIDRLVAVALQATGGGQDVTVPQQTPAQFWFGVAVLVVLGIAAFVVWHRTGFTGLPDDQAEQKARLQQQRQALSPLALRIPATADVTDYWGRLAETIDRVEGGLEDSRGRVGDATPTPQALAEAREELSRAWDPVLGRLPRRARQAIGLGVLLAIFGATAVSTSVVVSTLESESSGTTLPQLLEAAVSLTQSVLSIGPDIVTAFPFADIVWAFAFAYTIMAIQWIYSHWYVTATLVILGGIVLAILEWRAEGSDDQVLYDRRRTGLNVVFAAGVVWLLGVVPAALGAALVAVGSVAGVPGVGAWVGTAGAAVGFVLALGATFILGLGALAGLLQDVLLAAGAGVRLPVLGRFRPGLLRWKARVAIFGPPFGDAELPARDDREANYALAGSIVVRRFLHAANGVFVVVLLAYVAVAVVDGRLVRVLGALASAPTDTKLLVALAVGVPLAVVAYQIRAVWPDLKVAAVESLARQRVRVAVLGRAVPTLGVAAAYVVAYQFTRSIPLALVLAVAFGLALYAGYVLLLKSQHAVSMLEFDESLPKETLVQVYPPVTVEVTTDDGRTREETRYYAVINGETGVMWDSRGRFEEYLRETVMDCRDRDRTPSSPGVWHARDAFEYGIIEPDRTRKKIDERIRKRTVTPLREANGAVKRSTVMDSLERLPEDRREDRWREWFEMGVLRQVDDLLVLEYDPWTEDGKRGRSS